MFFACFFVIYVGAVGYIDPDLAEQYKRLQEIERSLDKVIGEAEAAADLATPDNLAEREAVVADLTKEADDIIRRIGKSVVAKKNLTAIPLVLVNSTATPGDQSSWPWPSTSSGFIPESRDFSGWVICDSGAVLHYKPLIAVEREADGILFRPTQNKTCEVKQFELTMRKSQDIVLREVFELKRQEGVLLLDFEKRVEFEDLSFAILNNWGDPNRTCVGTFDLYYQPE